MKPDKPYGDIRHEVKIEYMKKYIDPIGYAKEKAIKTIDEVGEIKAAIKDLTDSYKHEINKIKILVQAYFSDEVQMDESPMGAMRRNQIRKELLEFATKKV